VRGYFDVKPNTSKRRDTGQQGTRTSYGDYREHAVFSDNEASPMGRFSQCSGRNGTLTNYRPIASITSRKPSSSILQIFWSDCDCPWI